VTLVFSSSLLRNLGINIRHFFIVYSNGLIFHPVASLHYTACGPSSRPGDYLQRSLASPSCVIRPPAETSSYQLHSLVASSSLHRLKRFFPGKVTLLDRCDFVNRTFFFPLEDWHPPTRFCPSGSGNYGWSSAAHQTFAYYSLLAAHSTHPKTTNLPYHYIVPHTTVLSYRSFLPSVQILRSFFAVILDSVG